MINVTAADPKTSCSTCGASRAAVIVQLHDGGLDYRFPLCDRCANTLMKNLKGKEAPAHVGKQ